jgi:hypothetical protein
MRHYKNEWCIVSAKVKALKEGGYGLRLLRLAIGSLQEHIQPNVNYESDVDIWAGADAIAPFESLSENMQIPRQDDKDIRVSLFGPSHPIAKRTKVGRSPLSSDKNPTSSFERRSNRHCHNKNCVRWYTCPGGQRRYFCPSYSNHSNYLTLSEARFRSKQFNQARRARPELSADECAILAASYCNEV